MTLPTATARAEGQVPLSFLLFLALMTSVVALTIDAVLPALDRISADLAFEHENDRQAIVLNVLLGMGFSQLIFGPMADAIGRKRTALAGWAIYLAGTVIAVGGGTAEWMLAGRFLQGLGAGGPRVVANTMARDLYEGNALARVVSLVMTVFMLVPILAPLIGQGIEAVLGWQAIFALYIALALISGGWYLLGVPETLDPAKRRPFRLRPLYAAFAEVLRTRQTICCALSAALVFGPFVVYLATAQQVLEELYALGPLFPLVFSSVAVAFGAATFLNARLVMRHGMYRCAVAGFALLIAVSGLVCALIWLGVSGPVPPLWIYLGAIGLIFVAVAILVANLTALALNPMGHMAGTAAAVINSVAALGSALIGREIAALYDGTLTPMLLGFLVLGCAGFALFWLGMRR
ncbi:MAG: multidrug effflux MFS transporter [Pseudomonadota bacterium]